MTPTDVSQMARYSPDEDSSRQPDVIVDMKPSPVPPLRPCATPDLQCIRPEDQSHDHNDTASICSFNSSVVDNSYSSNMTKTPDPTSVTNEAQSDFALNFAAPPTSDQQMTPSANLMANAFNLGSVPKLKKVPQPVVKNGSMPKPAQNSVQKQKEILFEEQKKQREEKLRHERMMQQEKIEREQQEQQRIREEQQRIANEPKPLCGKMQSSRKVHFSPQEAQRQQLASRGVIAFFM